MPGESDNTADEGATVEEGKNSAQEGEIVGPALKETPGKSESEATLPEAPADHATADAEIVSEAEDVADAESEHPKPSISKVNETKL